MKLVKKCPNHPNQRYPSPEKSSLREKYPECIIQRNAQTADQVNHGQDLPLLPFPPADREVCVDLGLCTWTSLTSLTQVFLPQDEGKYLLMMYPSRVKVNLLRKVGELAVIKRNIVFFENGWTDE